MPLALPGLVMRAGMLLLLIRICPTDSTHPVRDWQLRDRAGPRQVRRHRVGPVEAMGGGAAGMDDNACVVMILAAQD